MFSICRVWLLFSCLPPAICEPREYIRFRTTRPDRSPECQAFCIPAAPGAGPIGAFRAAFSFCAKANPGSRGSRGRAHGCNGWHCGGRPDHEWRTISRAIGSARPAILSMPRGESAGGLLRCLTAPVPPPRTSTAATAPCSNTIAGMPERKRGSSASPTCKPTTSVIGLRVPVFIVLPHTQETGIGVMFPCHPTRARPKLRRARLFDSDASAGAALETLSR